MLVIRIRDPPRMQTGDPFAAEKGVDATNRDKEAAPQTEYYINLISAIFSILGIIVLILQDRALRFNFQTWVSFVPSVRHPDSVGLVKDFTTDFEELCDIKNLSIATFDMNISKQNTTYVLMPMAYESESVPAALLLLWVLAVSAAFQTYRAKHMWYIEKMQRPWIAKLVLLGVHVVVHIIIIARIATLEITDLDGGEKATFSIALFVTCVCIMIYTHKYNNSGPDFGRWLEYMLTAPIQIVLIAMSVFLRDQSTLFALRAAQACMLLCGVVIEGNLESIYETNDEGPVSTEEQRLLELKQNSGETDQENGADFLAKVIVITKKRARHDDKQSVFCDCGQCNHRDSKYHDENRRNTGSTCPRVHAMSDHGATRHVPDIGQQVRRALCNSFGRVLHCIHAVLPVCTVWRGPDSTALHCVHCAWKGNRGVVLCLLDIRRAQRHSGDGAGGGISRDDLADARVSPYSP